jgi:ABC-2 type transport system permease protein
MLATLWGFLRRDFANEISYKLSFALQVLSLFPVMLMFFFLSRMIGDTVAGALGPYGGAYFPFVLVGIVLDRYQVFSLGSFSSSLRESQLTGTLEAVLVAPIPLPLFLAGSGLYSFGLNSLRVLFYLVAGSLLFGVRFHLDRLPLAALTMVLTVGAISSVGLLSASFIALFKRGDPISYAFTVASWLLGGVYYPVAILPRGLQALAALLPMTHALEAMRFSLLGSGPSAGLGGHLAVLAAWAGLGLPLSYCCFRLALERARAQGTLGHF